MITYKIIENYGVYGPGNEVQFETSTLSSCSAVIMYNKNDNRIGLYHYGALTLGNAKVQEAMLQMMNDMQPTRIVPWPAHIIDFGYGAE